MPLQLEIVPCRKDNYAFLIHDPETGATGIVDVPEAAPILAALQRRGWTPTDILLTHHHGDHVDGVAEVLAAYPKAPPRVLGAEADAHRLPPLDRALAEGASVAVGDAVGHVLDVSGHTVGHIAYHFPESRLVFTGDSLMAMGCGRLFEGDAPMMWDSLRKIAALPDATRVCSGHDYLLANGRFADTVDPGNDAAAARLARHDADRDGAVHVTLAEERATNPFLRSDSPELRGALGLSDAPAVEVFAELRRRKDAF